MADEKQKENPHLKMVVWVKKDGTEISLNSFPDTIAYAESLGWKRKGSK